MVSNDVVDRINLRASVKFFLTDNKTLILSLLLGAGAASIALPPPVALSQQQSWPIPDDGSITVSWCHVYLGCQYGGGWSAQVILDYPEMRFLGCYEEPGCDDDEWTSPYSFPRYTVVTMHVLLTSPGGTTTRYDPLHIIPLPSPNLGAEFEFDIGGPGSYAAVIVTLNPVTPTCDSLPIVRMDYPEDGAYYFTCRDQFGNENDYLLPELERHSPVTECVPTVQWREDLLDALDPNPQWHAAQALHTATLMPENHPVNPRTLVVQVKAQNPETFVAMERATIRLYHAQDLAPEVYRDSINVHATAAANDVGVPVDTFKTYMKAILCLESRWQQYFGYCSPKVGFNPPEGGDITSTDWGIAAINDFYWKQDSKVMDPRDGRLFGPLDDNRRKWDPFYGIRFEAKYLSRFILLMNLSSKFSGLTVTNKFENAICMYNGGEKEGPIWAFDPNTGQTIENPALKRLRQDPKKAQKVKNMLGYFEKVKDKIQNPCYPF